MFTFLSGTLVLATISSRQTAVVSSQSMSSGKHCWPEFVVWGPKDYVKFEYYIFLYITSACNANHRLLGVHIVFDHDGSQDLANGQSGSTTKDDSLCCQRGGRLYARGGRGGTKKNHWELHNWHDAHHAVVKCINSLADRVNGGASLNWSDLDWKIIFGPTWASTTSQAFLSNPHPSAIVLVHCLTDWNGSERAISVEVAASAQRRVQ